MPAEKRHRICDSSELRMYNHQHYNFEEHQFDVVSLFWSIASSFSYTCDLLLLGYVCAPFALYSATYSAILDLPLMAHVCGIQI